MFGTKIIATATATFAFAASIGIQTANAAPYGFKQRSDARIAVIDYRIRSQAARIRQALRSGRLERVEAYRVRFELSHIRVFRAQYLQDDWLSNGEASHLDHLLDVNSRRLRRFARNGDGWRAQPAWRSRLSRYDAPRH